MFAVVDTEVVQWYHWCRHRAFTISYIYARLKFYAFLIQLEAYKPKCKKIEKYILYYTFRFSHNLSTLLRKIKIKYKWHVEIIELMFHNMSRLSNITPAIFQEDRNDMFLFGKKFM